MEIWALCYAFALACHLVSGSASSAAASKSTSDSISIDDKIDVGKRHDIEAYVNNCRRETVPGCTLIPQGECSVKAECGRRSPTLSRVDYRMAAHCFAATRTFQYFSHLWHPHPSNPAYHSGIELIDASNHRTEYAVYSNQRLSQAQRSLNNGLRDLVMGSQPYMKFIAWVELVHCPR